MDTPGDQHSNAHESEEIIHLRLQVLVWLSSERLHMLSQQGQICTFDLTMVSTFRLRLVISGIQTTASRSQHRPVPAPKDAALEV